MKDIRSGREATSGGGSIDDYSILTRYMDTHIMDTSSMVSTGISEAEVITATFHWADYVILISVLVISGATGVFFGIKQKKHNTADQFLVAGRSMPIIPVSVSIFVSWLSAISFIGDPVEVYTYGSIYLIIAIGYALAIPPVAHIFAPAYYRMNIISVNEFLRKKYGSLLSGAAAFLGGFSYLVYLGVALYAPSLALGQMTGLDVNICILVNGAVCVFYTSLGGMKAVLWADTIQTVIMLVGIIACLIEATLNVGGMGKVFEIANRGGRINFAKFNPHPLARATIWTYLIGGFFRVFNPYISLQAWVQRYFTLKSERDLKIALYLNIPMYILFCILFGLTGLVMFAYFDGCDPVAAGKVKATGQMVPLMVMETLGKYPGVPGLFLATLCSAALSTLSSGQSALAAVALRDAVIPLHKKRTGEDLSDKESTICAIGLSILFGFLNMGLAFVILQLQGTSIFPLTIKITGSMGSPIAGIFVLAILFPFVHTFSAIIGCIISLSISMWIALGSFLDPPAPYPGEILPVSVDRCSQVNGSTTSLPYTTMSSSYSEHFTHPVVGYIQEQGFGVNEVYKMSPLLFSVVGMVITVVLSLILQGLCELIKYIRRKDDTYKDNNMGANSFEMVPLSKHD